MKKSFRKRGLLASDLTLSKAMQRLNFRSRSAEGTEHLNGWRKAWSMLPLRAHSWQHRASDFGRLCFWWQYEWIELVRVLVLEKVNEGASAGDGGLRWNHRRRGDWAVWLCKGGKQSITCGPCGLYNVLDVSQQIKKIIKILFCHPRLATSCFIKTHI